LTSTIITLIQGNPDIDYLFTHKTSGKTVSLSTKEMRAELGEVPLSNGAVLDWIKEYLSDQYKTISE
jgi:hypothetical protein